MVIFVSLGNIKLPLDIIKSIGCSIPATNFLKFNTAAAAFVVISNASILHGSVSDKNSNLSVTTDSCDESKIRKQFLKNIFIFLV